MSNCEDLEEYCAMYCHLWNCLDELFDVGITSGDAVEELDKQMYEYVELIHIASKRILDNRDKCMIR